MLRAKLPLICASLSALVLALVGCPAAPAATACFYDEPTIWESIQRMTVDQLLGTLILLGFLVILLTVGFVRAREIYRAIKQNRAYESRALTALFYNRVEEAVSSCVLFPKSPVARVVTAGLQSFQPCVSQGKSVKPSKPSLHRAVVAQSSMLKRGIWILGAIGWSSPVIGLVTSLITSSHYGGGPPITFCFGLMIAVPALWLHRGLTGEVELLQLEIDRMSLSIFDQITEQIDDEFDKSVALSHDPLREIRLPLSSRHTSPLC